MYKVRSIIHTSGYPKKSDILSQEIHKPWFMFVNCRIWFM